VTCPRVLHVLAALALLVAIAGAARGQQMRRFDPRFDAIVAPDAKLERASRTFADGREFAKHARGVPDGLDVDAQGNVFAAGPGGIHVFAPDGTLLGSLWTGVATSNSAFGGDGSDLYVTASDAVYRIRLLGNGMGD